SMIVELAPSGYVYPASLPSRLSMSPTLLPYVFSFFFFNDTATTEIYTLSLHDALPISRSTWSPYSRDSYRWTGAARWVSRSSRVDRKSTRLNSSHVKISYAVFCLKKKKKQNKNKVHEPDHHMVAKHASLHLYAAIET